jgi:formamidopyrimidine-DNA glycosylase
LPELPEVETVLRSLAPHVVGRTIVSASFSSRFVTQGSFETAERQLAGTRIEGLQRHGKHILVRLDRGWLHIHLGMTGKLLWGLPRGPYTRAILELDEGRIVYDDIRQFGRVNYYSELPPWVRTLGPDAMSVSLDIFQSRLRKRTGGLKAALLDQKLVGGLGNIYVDEILFASSIHPKTRIHRLSERRIERLYDAMLVVLQSAIQHRGSSISDYVDAGGLPGRFQQMHRVYGKAGSPCTQCGTPIRRILVAQRGTHYCPRCQRP